MSDHDALTCPQCLLGILKPETVSYTGILHGMFINVPNLVALTCDVCGYRDYPPGVFLPLEALFDELPLPGEALRRAAKLPSFGEDGDLLERLRQNRLKP